MKETDNFEPQGEEKEDLTQEAEPCEDALDAPDVAEEAEIDEIIQKNKKTKRIVIIAFAATLVLVFIAALIPGLFFDDGEEYREYEPIDPSELYETKDEDFDIMEYEEYLALDRNIYFLEGNEENYTKTAIDIDDAAELGEDVALAYELLECIIYGDFEEYNLLVSDKLKKDSFTQQQVYDITLRRQKANEGYEYAIRVEYKIHENNGTYRNNILPDSSRYLVYCMKREGGALKIVDILEPYYEKYDPDAMGGSCSSSLGGGAVAVLMAAALSTIVVLKKKED
jgi:hypothetical protein